MRKTELIHEHKRKRKGGRRKTVIVHEYSRRKQRKMATEFDPRVWYSIFRCVRCGYKSHVTDVCWQCPEMPLKPATRQVRCSKHRTFHIDAKGNPLMHASLSMGRTEWASRFNPKISRNERRKIKNLPEDAILK